MTRNRDAFDDDMDGITGDRTAWWRHFRIVALGAIGALFVALLLIASSESGKAADLGGNCCTDLEERIAELEATTARKGNRKVSVVIVGQVNKAIYWYDAKDFGLGSDTRVIENGADESRVAITGAAQLRPGWWAGYTLELGQGQTGIEVNALGPGAAGIGTDNDLYTRQSFAFVKSDDLGTVSLGLQSMATDDLTHQNVASTDAASKRLTMHPVGGISVSLGPLGLFNVPLEPFNGRKANAVKYVSPTFAGFSASAAWDSSDDSWDAALRYAGSGGGFEFKAALGYYDDKTNDMVEALGFGLDISSTTITANAGVKHVATGVFAQGSWARLDFDLPVGSFDTDAWHAQAGIERKWFEIGQTTLFGEYADWSDLGLSFYGVGINQNVSGAIDFYALARRVEIDGAGEADTILGGARVRF